MLRDEIATDRFVGFVTEAEPRLRRALTAAFGSDIGCEATAEALAYGWQNWERISGMANPVGYLYKVGRDKGRRMKSRRRPREESAPPVGQPWVEPALVPALRSLSERQRVVVSLLHAFDWSMSEVASLLGISKSSVQKHEQRAMARLRSELGVEA